MEVIQSEINRVAEQLIAEKTKRKQEPLMKRIAHLEALKVKLYEVVEKSTVVVKEVRLSASVEDFINQWNGDVADYGSLLITQGTASKIHNKYRIWCDGKQPIPLNHFGRHLSALVEKGKLSRRFKDGINLYSKLP